MAVNSKPKITFAQPIRDQRNATAALSLEPKTAGKWEWLDDKTLRCLRHLHEDGQQP